jgi:hypothetical protein
MKWGLGKVDEEEERKEKELNDEEAQRGFHAVYAEGNYL